MAAAHQTDAEEDRSGLLKLAVAGLAVGALAGLVGSAFHALVDRAGALRDALVAWSYTAPWIGWLVPVVRRRRGGISSRAGSCGASHPRPRAAASSTSRQSSAATRA